MGEAPGHTLREKFLADMTLTVLGSLKSAKYTCKFQIHVLQRVAVAVRLEEDLCGKLGECSLGASRSVAHHLDERYGPSYRGNATREFAT